MRHVPVYVRRRCVARDDAARMDAHSDTSHDTPSVKQAFRVSSFTIPQPLR